MDSKYVKIRILIVALFFLLLFGAIGARAVQLQIYRGPWLSRQASNEIERSVTTTGKRGTIYSHNMRVMAISTTVTSIAAYPGDIEDIQVTAQALAKALKMKAARIRKKLTKKKSFVWIKRQTTARETRAVRELKLKGIGFVSEPNRFYPSTTLAAQVVGFTGVDGKGLEGIEFYYDRLMQGTSRKFTVLKDANHRKFQTQHQPSASGRGCDLVLTIDESIQHITESALKETVEKYSARSALAIVMQPRTGAVLSIAHYPAFNPNAYQDYAKPLYRNRAITDSFEPGSTMKIFTAAAALEYGNITSGTTFFCENGAYRISNNVVHDTHNHGWLSLLKIVKYSSNIGAAKISEKIGAHKLYQTFRDFGFGVKTGIDCPGEIPGSLTSYTSWSNIDTAAISFGHGISVSAIQMITALSAIANDGILMKPYIVEKITDPNSRIPNRFKPQKVRRVISVRTARIVKNIMKAVVTKGGTGVNAALEGYSVGGKTGTARKFDENGRYSNTKHIASFIGFAPVDNPQIAVLVVVDEPQDQYYGSIVAAPLFKEIAQQTLTYLNVPPDGSGVKLRVSLDSGTKG
jgi:cell division protein FtsI (penicillin-binding protein 3)